MRIRLFDKEFEHIKPPSYAGYEKPKYFEWDKESQNFPFAFYTERCLHMAKDNPGKKIAWLLEPRAIHDYGYDYVDNHSTDFDYILTSEKHMLDKYKHARFFPAGATWIWDRHWKVYDKQENVQIIASKKAQAPGHKLRHEVVSALGDKIDYVCGNAYRIFNYKMDVLKRFRYAIVIENSKVDYYWTDKIIDCFATGTIPIFWGCPSIGDFFDERGMYTFDTIDDLSKILDKVSETDYNEKKPFVEKNFDLAKQYATVEDYIFKTFVEKELL